MPWLQMRFNPNVRVLHWQQCCAYTVGQQCGCRTGVKTTTLNRPIAICDNWGQTRRCHGHTHTVVLYTVSQQCYTRVTTQTMLCMITMSQIHTYCAANNVMHMLYSNIRDTHILFTVRQQCDWCTGMETRSLNSHTACELKSGITALSWIH